MHSIGFRVNALVTFALTILDVMCVIVSVSDCFNYPSPTSQVQVLHINWFSKNLVGDDEVGLKLDIVANLHTWNTKQVFVFIAAEYETRKNALNKGSNLRGKNFNLTLHWHVMPKVGKMFANKIVMPGDRLPEAYR